MNLGDAQYIMNYYTKDCEAFVDSLKTDTTIMPMIKDLMIAVGMADQKAIATGLPEVFYGSIGETTAAIFSLVGLGVFVKLFKHTPLPRLFISCCFGLILLNTMYLGISIYNVMSPLYLLACTALGGVVSVLVVMAVLTYAAACTPKENQATYFALLMGMSNLAQTIGLEKWGSWLYNWAGGLHTVVGADGKPVEKLIDASAGMAAAQFVSIAYSVFLIAFVLIVTSRGLISNKSSADIAG